MMVYVALLRGVNVGGHKLIRSADLKQLFESLHYRHVVTILQSGNVVFLSEQTNSHQMVADIEAAIQSRFGFASPVILRTSDEWRNIADAHPFVPEQLQQPARILVTLMKTAPDAQAAAQAFTSYLGSEILTLRGRELFIYYPDGMGKSRLDNAFIEKKLRVVATGRNWNTIQKIWSAMQQTE